MSWFKFSSQKELDLLKAELFANVESCTKRILESIDNQAARTRDEFGGIKTAIPLMNAQLAKICEAQSAILVLLKQQTALIVETRDKAAQAPGALKPQLEALADSLSHVRNDFKEVAGKIWSSHATTVKDVNAHTSEVLGTAHKHLQSGLVAAVGSGGADIKTWVKAQVAEGAGQLVQSLGPKLDAAAESFALTAKASQESIQAVCDALGEEIEKLKKHLETETAKLHKSLIAGTEKPDLYELQVRITDGEIFGLRLNNDPNKKWAHGDTRPPYRLEHRYLTGAQAEAIRKGLPR